jgi:hypothetical protein
MAKRRHDGDNELPFVALMDTMTNVVGVLTIVLVMMGISIAHAVKKVMSEIPPATATQLADAVALIAKSKTELAANQKLAATLSKIPSTGNIDTEIDLLEIKVKEKNVKLFDLPVLGKELTAKSNERTKKESELSALIAERDRLKALLDATPVPKVKEAEIVRIPNSRDIPEAANIYYCFVRADQVYLVDPISAKEMIMAEIKREELKDPKLIKERIKVPKKLDRYIYDQTAVVNLFAKKPLEVRGQKIQVPFNKPWTRLVVRMTLPNGDGDASLADMQDPKGKFHILANKISSLPKVVLMFQVNLDGFATYLKAREIIDRYRIPCGWEINGNTFIQVPLDFEVNRLEEPPPWKPPDPNKLPAPKRQLD